MGTTTGSSGSEVTSPSGSSTPNAALPRPTTGWLHAALGDLHAPTNAMTLASAETRQALNAPTLSSSTRASSTTLQESRMQAGVTSSVVTVPVNLALSSSLY